MKNSILISALLISTTAYADTADDFFIQVQLGIPAADECLKAKDKRSNACRMFRVINDDVSSTLKKKKNRDEVLYRANSEQKTSIARYNFRLDKINAMLAGK